MSAGELGEPIVGAAGFVQHINREHPDSVAFLAAHTASRPSITEARLARIDRRGVDLVVTSETGDERLRLPFPVDVEDVFAVRRQLRAWFDEARSASDGPLTSLELLFRRSGDRHDRRHDGS